MGLKPQSNKLTRVPPELVQIFRLWGVHIGARALHVLKLIWFGYIARQSQCGGGGVISSFKLFLPAFVTRREREGEGVGTLWLEQAEKVTFVKNLHCIHSHRRSRRRSRSGLRRLTDPDRSQPPPLLHREGSHPIVASSYVDQTLPPPPGKGHFLKGTQE
jgi:hypothetical protein